MDLYTIQQILERCYDVMCKNVIAKFDIFDDEQNKSIRMLTYEIFGWDRYTYISEEKIKLLDFLGNYCEDGYTWCMYTNTYYPSKCTRGKKFTDDEYVYPKSSVMFECFKCSHENGCTWDTLVCKCALGIGNLKCIKYAHANGCPINIRESL